MALKEDFYSGAGSNMHAAYNIQIIVSKGIALTYYVGQERTDFYAFIPAIEQFRADYGFYPKNLCANAGYGSWKNYAYMAKHGIGNYVKFQDWEQSRKGNAMDLYSFDGEGELVCLNGKTATRHSEYNGIPRAMGIYTSSKIAKGADTKRSARPRQWTRKRRPSTRKPSRKRYEKGYQ